jgi:hypothetical protein
LSHALSQSVKISLFEELIASTIDQTKDLPKSLSETGKIGVSVQEIRDRKGHVSDLAGLSMITDASKGDYETDRKSVHFTYKLGRIDSGNTGKFHHLFVEQSGRLD